MDLHARQAHYWNTTGAAKTFTHPLHGEWLDGVSRRARVLDHGCGYGRITAELSDLGFTRVSGVDPSPALIARARRLRPELDFAVAGSPTAADRPAASADLIVMFAVLTCIPDDQAQRDLVAGLHRVLAPGGLIYVSDLLLQSDERSRRRYDAYAEKAGGPYGVFGTDDGAVCRHHEAGWIRSLLAAFEPVAERHIDVATMNGHHARGLQVMARK